MMTPDGNKLYVVRFQRKVDQQQHRYPPIFTMFVRVFAKDISEAMNLAWDYTKLPTNEYEIQSTELEDGGYIKCSSTNYCMEG